MRETRERAMKAISWPVFSPLCTRATCRKNEWGRTWFPEVQPNFAMPLPKSSHRLRSNERRSPCPAKPLITRYLLSNSATLPSYLTGNRQIGASAELQGLTLFATASCQSHSRYHSRDDDDALQVHGLLSYPGNRTFGVPGCNAQIKNAAAYSEVFHGG